MSACARCSASLPDGASRLCPACLLAIAAESSGADSPTITAFGSGSTSSAPGAPQLDPGQIFGAYRIERLLGKGGMGEVYEAEQLEHGRRVALKVLNQRMADPEDRARFLREGQLAASVNHPNSVYIFGSEEIAGAPVITMELLAGGTLKDVVERDGPMEPARAVDAILQVIAGLDAASQGGILHRDVKPSNCFVDVDGTVKIGDFGLSISTLARYGDVGAGEGSIQGTPQFAAPEQLKGLPLDLRADIYAVGATLYYLLTGEAPLDAGDLRHLVDRVINEMPVPPAKRSKRIPSALSSIVMACLAKESASRPAGYAALFSLLQPFASSSPVAAPFLRRTLAGFIDESALSVLTAAVLFGAALTTDASGLPPWLLGATTVAVSLALSALYYGLPEGLTGKSLGKGMCGLRVIHMAGGLPGIGRAAWRALIFTAISSAPQLIVTAALRNGRSGRQSAELFAGSLALLAGRLIVFARAFRNRERRALHDQATATRVVLDSPMAERPAYSAGPAAVVAHGPRFGAYRVVDADPARQPGQVMAAVDERLQRPVWLRIAAPQEPELPQWRRVLARPGRLRWLGGRRLAHDAWDVFEAPGGRPFADGAAAKHEWQAVRFWTSDLAEELRATLQDPSTPQLTVDRVWIDGRGRARLLEWPSPGVVATAPANAPCEDAARNLLLAVAAAADGPLPLHARAFLDAVAVTPAALTASGIPTPPRLTTAPARVSRRVRAKQTLLAAAPVLMLCIFFLAMAVLVRQGLQSGQAMTDIRGLAGRLLELDAQPGGPESAHEQRLIAVYLATTLEPAIAKLAPTRSAMREDIAALFARAEQAVASVGRASPEEIREATTFADNYLARTRALGAEIFDIRMTTTAILTGSQFLLLVLALASLLIVAVKGAPPTFAQTDVAVVDLRGAAATRGRVLFRTFVVWLPVLGLNVLTIALLAGVSWPVHSPYLQTGVFAGLIAAAAFGIAHPQRALQDRIAGTWLVPR